MFSPELSPEVQSLVLISVWMPKMFSKFFGSLYWNYLCHPLEYTGKLCVLQSPSSFCLTIPFFVLFSHELGLLWLSFYSVCSSPTRAVRTKNHVQGECEPLTSITHRLGWRTGFCNEGMSKLQLCWCPSSRLLWSSLFSEFKRVGELSLISGLSYSGGLQRLT